MRTDIAVTVESGVDRVREHFGCYAYQTNTSLVFCMMTDYPYVKSVQQRKNVTVISIKVISKPLARADVGQCLQTK